MTGIPFSKKKVRLLPKDESFMRREYGLKGMPFKIRIATDLQLQAWVDREKELKRWSKILGDASKEAASNFLVFIIGDYGWKTILF